MSQEIIWDFIKDQPKQIAWSAKAIYQIMQRQNKGLSLHCCRRCLNSLVKYQYLGVINIDHNKDRLPWRRFYVLYELRYKDPSEFTILDGEKSISMLYLRQTIPKTSKIKIISQNGRRT